MNEKVSDTLVKDGGHTQDKKNPFSGKLLRGALLTMSSLLYKSGRCDLELGFSGR